MPIASALRSSQSAWVIAVPAGVNQPRSEASAPVRKRRRRNTGCDRRNATRFLLKASRPPSTADQSNQDTSLSWQYALLFPPWVRPSSSPPSSSGTPNDNSSVVSIARDCLARRASTSGSGVGPSAPQFHERLSSAPSRLLSPLASLCLVSYETRSRSVNPSCTVIRFTDAVGRRPSSPYRSAEQANRVANSPRPPIFWLRQKSRMVSRYLPFHSRHSTGNRPRS